MHIYLISILTKTINIGVKGNEVTVRAASFSVYLQRSPSCQSLGFVTHLSLYVLHAGCWAGAEDSPHAQFTVPLNNFRVRTDGVQENQIPCDVSCTLEVLKLDFQPIPPISEF